MTFASTYITFLNAAIWCQNHHLSFLPVSAFKYWLSASMPSSRYDPMRSQNIRKNHADRPGPFQQIKLKFLKLGLASLALASLAAGAKTGRIEGASSGKPDVEKPYGTSVQLRRYLWGRVPD